MDEIKCLLKKEQPTRIKNNLLSNPKFVKSKLMTSYFP